jgi:ATP-binding cassette, subfamily C, bacterial CydD
MDGASLVLLDEPTAHLDPDNAAAVRAGVARLLEGATGIVVAHDAGWADLADEVVRLEAGRPAGSPVPPVPSMPSGAAR